MIAEKISRLVIASVGVLKEANFRKVTWPNLSEALSDYSPRIMSPGVGNAYEPSNKPVLSKQPRSLRRKNKGRRQEGAYLLPACWLPSHLIKRWDRRSLRVTQRIGKQWLNRHSTGRNSIDSSSTPSWPNSSDWQRRIWQRLLPSILPRIAKHLSLWTTWDQGWTEFCCSKH